ncbi:TIGR04076 family protein [Holdemanella porci]|uniref:TIGR04076 family protein n=1 Tax=Holdemanella porci TaxID=2652276 RepID=UPI003AEF5EA1
MPFCSEAWDAILRYIYTGLQRGSIMKGWMKKENEMIIYWSDGTRSVISRLKELIMIRNNRTVLIEME